MDEVKFNLALNRSMAEALDKEAAEIGISRSALIKIILHKHIKEN